eukprot:CAMPEP_0117486980 /NCGR_PEP_ID=MMETSP0784-20121206/15760_1 /TAXON_ID=39447 /ORGANISM="" /LENGTH=156 /DNA_ID=CAMNT_0005281615 /DNA_START=390 /DNA_END=855 /DNA_ORIENTATION=-
MHCSAEGCGGWPSRIGSGKVRGYRTVVVVWSPLASAASENDSASWAKTQDDGHQLVNASSRSLERPPMDLPAPGPRARIVATSAHDFVSVCARGVAATALAETAAASADAATHAQAQTLSTPQPNPRVPTVLISFHCPAAPNAVGTAAAAAAAAAA